MYERLRLTEVDPSEITGLPAGPGAADVLGGHRAVLLQSSLLDHLSASQRFICVCWVVISGRWAHIFILKLFILVGINQGKTL